MMTSLKWNTGLAHAHEMVNEHVVGHVCACKAPAWRMLLLSELLLPCIFQRWPHMTVSKGP